MKVHFKFPRAIEGKHYAKGEHALPDALSDHWFLKGLVAAGDASLVEAPRAVETESMDAPLEHKDVPEAQVPAEASEKAPSQAQRRKGK